MLRAMLSESGSVVKRSLLARWRGFVRDPSADDGHADGKIFEPILWSRQQILLEHDEVSPLARFDRTLLVFLESQMGAVDGRRPNAS